MKLNRLVRYSAAAAIAAVACGTAWSQTAIPASFAHPKSSANSSATGFVIRAAQATSSSGALPNSSARAEAQLAGFLINPATGQPYENIADLSAFNADGTYFEPGIISYNKTGSPLPFPGTPSLVEPDNGEDYAMEAVAYLDLAVGSYSMIVNSDDGFRVTVGADARDQLSAIPLGAYEGGRGATDSSFDFSISQAGLYSFRLVYYQGGGDASVDWYTAPVGNPDGRTWINDTGNGGVAAYRALTTATAPYVSFAQPVPNATDVSPSAPLVFVIRDGSPALVNAASVALYFDGTKTAAVGTKTGDTTKITYQPPTLLDSLSTHTVKLVFADNAVTPAFRTNEYSFKVSSVGNIKLPAPIYVENFDEIEEGALPAGWTVINHTDSLTAGFDLDDPHSDAYLDWVCISSNRVWRVGEGELNNWEGIRRLTTREQYVNGVRVTSLVTNNFMYAESDTRGGGTSQVQYMFTKDYDLSGYTNVYVSYNSMYEQNQDSIGAVEYSIDGGTTWEPIVYMIDQDDIKLGTDGKTDGYLTLSAQQDDTAIYTDLDTGEDIGHKYGAFIGIQDTNRWPSLAPYISGRVNDDFTESKRVELFRLPKADKQKTVRLRFAQAGTGSWYFGIDNLGFYSITTVDAPKITVPPASIAVVAGFKVDLTVAATGVSLSYQWKHSGTNLPGATTATYSIAAASAADAGGYTVQVSNPGNLVESAEAILTVLSTAEPLNGLSTGLVTHLKFDGDYSDASGNGVAGAAVNSPTFEASPIGQAVHIVTTKDGSQDNYVTLNYPSQLKFGDENTDAAGTDFTIAFWVKLNSQADDQPFISNKDWSSSNNQGWGIFSQGSGKVRNNLTGPDSATKYSSTLSAGLNDQAWHALTVVVRRKSVVQTYLDGNILNASPITTVGSIDTTLAVNIGQDGTGSYTDGGSAEIDMQVDDLGIWRRALTYVEVSGIYKRGVAGKSFELPVGGGTPVSFGTPVIAGGNLNLTWTGGTGPFKVQTKADLSAANWTDVTTTSEHSYSAPAGAASGYFRVVDSGQ